MKKKCFRSSRIIQMNVCLLLLLGIGLNCRSLSNPAYNINCSFIVLNSTTGIDVFKLKNLVDFTGKLQLMWIPDSNFYRTANAGFNFDQLLSEEDAYYFENWMIQPDSLYSSSGSDPFDTEINAEDKIYVEDWMVSTATWNKSIFR